MTDNDMPILVISRILRLVLKDCPDSIPMIILDARQAMKNHGRTLQELRKRGGVSPSEALALIGHRPWSPMLHQHAVNELNDAVTRMCGVVT